MKMSTFLKGAVGAGVVAVSWVNANFSPLFWVLLVLIAIDLILNVKHEGKQFEKLTSAGFGLGIPSLLSNQIDIPHFGKLIVTLMCLVYLQVVLPQVLELLKKLNVSKDPVVNQMVQLTEEELIQKVADRFAQQAQAQAKTIDPNIDLSQASVGGGS